MKKNQFAVLVLPVLLMIGSCHAQQSRIKKNSNPETEKLTPATKSSSSASSNQLVGGGCDGCEIMYVGMPQQIDATDTSAGWTEKGQKLLITGYVYQADGQTPAAGVVVYYWQTDNNGYYSPGPALDANAKRHGHIRGWIRTGTDGKYSVYTIRPAPYPGESIPAHIHISVKEPQINNEYYIDDLVFDDDPLLTGKNRTALENRGGSGVLRLIDAGKIKVAEHNIILGLNIPNYPKTNRANIDKSGSHPSSETHDEIVHDETLPNQSNRNEIGHDQTDQEGIIESGLQVGEDNPSFTPYHAAGPDKGTRTCPVCKYGRFHGIIYFAGENIDWPKTKMWLRYLEQESISQQKYLKGYFVYGNSKNYSKRQRELELSRIAAELNLTHLALTFVPSFNDRESEVYLNKINPAALNTIVVYRNRNIIAKFVNLDPGQQQFRLVSDAIERTRSHYLNVLTDK